MYRLLASAAGIAAIAVAANAEPGAGAADATFGLLDKLTGNWVLRGELGGKQTIHDVSANWTLNHLYVRLDETSRERDEFGQPTYAASIFIGWVSDRNIYSCVWLDSTEVVSSTGNCTAHPSPNQIPFVFKDQSGSVIFYNTFSYDPRLDRWEWQLDNFSKGKRTPFGHVVLVRK